jgi:phosphocarrier protein FPr
VVGIVIVSHSARLAEGVVELAREMGGPDVALEPAGGLDEPEGGLGTDAERVMAAVERARSDDGVLVLMDLGSALMSAEMAVEMLGGEDGGRVLLSEAPLVEGAVAAAAAARGGASLDDVAAEARGALRAKAAHLGEEEGDAAGAGGEAAPEPPDEGPSLRLTVANRLGLHARPAARFVGAATRFDAEVTVRNETTGRGPASGRSLTGLATLGVRQGHDIEVRASGPEAQAALDAIAALAEENFGDEDGGGPAAEPAARRAGAERWAAEPAVGTEGRATEPAAGTEPRAGRAAPVGEPGAAAQPASAPKPGERLAGLRVAGGIAAGPARHLQAPDPDTEAADAPAGAPEEEWRRLDEARAATRADLERAGARVAEQAGAQEAAIFEAHRLLLDDDALLGPARRAIHDDGSSAPAAWRAAVEDAANAFAALDDAVLRERAADVRDVGRRVLAHLAGEGSAPAIAEPGILVAGELTPGETAALDRALVRGIATATGSATSHAAILARALGIPAVVGLGPAILAVAEGAALVLDGDQGAVIVEPDAEVAETYERRREAARARREAARERAGEPAVTRDGRRIEVAANLGSPAEAAGAVAQGADGVGLLRTEFLFLDRATLPGEDEQAEALKEIATALDGRPLIVRTLDVGADKPLPSVPQPPEANPFLGRRGIRLGLAEPDLLRVQLRAVLRVAAEHPLKVMFPMVATLGEVRAARALLDEERERLGIDPPLEVGIMVEVPSVAVQAERFAREVDFFSIGTNDLAQYALAAERGNAALAALTDGPVPALLALVRDVVRGATAHGRWVGVCGELAGDPDAAVLLVGLGVTELSMAAGLVPEVKEVVRGLDAGEAARLAAAAVDLDDAAAVRALVSDGRARC